jgi:hypothetical protein
MPTFPAVAQTVVNLNKYCLGRNVWQDHAVGARIEQIFDVRCFFARRLKLEYSKRCSDYDPAWSQAKLILFACSQLKSLSCLHL